MEQDTTSIRKKQTTNLKYQTAYPKVSMSDAEKRLVFTFRKCEASKTAPVKPLTKEDKEVLATSDEDDEESGAQIGRKRCTSPRGGFWMDWEISDRDTYRWCTRLPAQAATAKDNEVTVIKLTKEDDKGGDKDDVEEDLILQSCLLQHPTTANRIRASLYAHSGPGASIPAGTNKPEILRIHRRVEGHTIDWSSNPQDAVGQIATGDNTGNMFILRGNHVVLGRRMVAH
ncbi:hypothetical protein HOY82DRAFT_610608 [Tuber indicum]|nr:hypothetical protein HOY82DRAFT_610608 [Tuber indicum]